MQEPAKHALQPTVLDAYAPGLSSLLAAAAAPDQVGGHPPPHEKNASVASSATSNATAVPAVPTRRYGDDAVGIDVAARAVVRAAKGGADGREGVDAAAAVGNSSLLSRLQPPGWRYPLNLLSLAVTGGPARVGPLAWTVAGAVLNKQDPANAASFEAESVKSSKHVFPIVPSAVSLAAEGDEKTKAWWSDYKRAAILDTHAW